jgi:hypothetical protein
LQDGENGFVCRRFLLRNLDKQYENLRFYYMKRNNGHGPSIIKRGAVAATSTDLFVKVLSAQNGMLATKIIRQRTPTQSGSEHKYKRSHYLRHRILRDKRYSELLRGQPGHELTTATGPPASEPKLVRRPTSKARSTTPTTATKSSK